MTGMDAQGGCVGTGSGKAHSCESRCADRPIHGRRGAVACGLSGANPVEVPAVQRIIPNIGLEMVSNAVADRIGLHEQSPGWSVHAGTVVVEAVSLRIDALGGISKAAGGARAHAIGQIAALAQRPRARVPPQDRSARAVLFQHLVVLRGGDENGGCQRFEPPADRGAKSLGRGSRIGQGLWPVLLKCRSP
jgi:hypothetical protein